MTIEGLAAEGGIHWTYLSEIEHGKRNPSWEVVSSLAGALDAAIADLERIAGEQAGSGG
jgi:transcriptional regulator with XRE-family HTH domain